jgi:hypothetical protein
MPGLRIAKVSRGSGKGQIEIGAEEKGKMNEKDEKSKWQEWLKAEE